MVYMVVFRVNQDLRLKMLVVELTLLFEILLLPL